MDTNSLTFLLLRGGGLMSIPLESRESSGMLLLWPIDYSSKDTSTYLLEHSFWGKPTILVRSPVTLHHRVVRKPKTNAEDLEDEIPYGEGEVHGSIKRHLESGSPANSTWIIGEPPSWTFSKFLPIISCAKWGGCVKPLNSEVLHHAPINNRTEPKITEWVLDIPCISSVTWVSISLPVTWGYFPVCKRSSWGSEKLHNLLEVTEPARRSGKVLMYPTSKFG